LTYSIVDIETTGPGNRITEISIFKLQDGKVIDEFTSLVNPESNIPYNITVLTGIDNSMVEDAPLFSDIVHEVLSITEDTVFVAHSVNFDYNVIRKECQRINLDFTRKKLCTVRLSRKLLPGHRSYSLGKICKDLEIEIVGRHRARGDAEATVKLFNIMMALPEWDDVLSTFFKKQSKEATLPPNLPSEVFNAIPHEPGIYFFKNKRGKVIYVGKAKDLKKRVLGHFYNKRQKELDLCRETADISFELSGNELIALLMEDAAIKHHYPIYNTASKKTPRGYSIVQYEDRKGIFHLAVNNSKHSVNPLITFYNQNTARKYLEKICDHFELCPKYCHLQENVNFCTHYFLKSCKGICKSEEDVLDYNERVQLAKNEIVSGSDNILIKKQGRHFNETSFVLIKNGIYMGYGFIEKDISISHHQQLEEYLILQKDNRDVKGILRNYISNLNFDQQELLRMNEEVIRH